MAEKEQNQQAVEGFPRVGWIGSITLMSHQDTPPQIRIKSPESRNLQELPEQLHHENYVIYAIAQYATVNRKRGNSFIESWKRTDETIPHTRSREKTC